MPTGTRAWEGISILIFGRTPLAPARLESQIAEALPENEVRLESFEDYEQALDYCRDEKNVGFFMFIEDQKAPAIAEIFRNLAAPYLKSGWPAFGTIVYDSDKSIAGVEQIVFDRRLLQYLALEEFSDTSRVVNTMTRLWDAYVDATESTLFTERFRETILSCASAFLPSGSLSFYDRTLVLLSSNLNLSWKDTIWLRWALAVKSAHLHAPSVLQPHQDIASIFVSVPEFVSNSPEQVIQFCANRAVSLELRLFHVLMQLNHARISGNLSDLLTSLSQEVRPGAPAILKAVKNCHRSILHISGSTRVSA